VAGNGAAPGNRFAAARSWSTCSSVPRASSTTRARCKSAPSGRPQHRAARPSGHSGISGSLFEGVQALVGKIADARGVAKAEQFADAENLVSERPGVRVSTAQVADVDEHAAWTYNGTVPGPELRVTEDDRVRVTLDNELPEATSIHLHGLRLPNAEDGVAGLTQDAIAPGGSFTYDFAAHDPGTYWYHSHQNTSKQIPRGLYGALVVEPKGAQL